MKRATLLLFVLITVQVVVLDLMPVLAEEPSGAVFKYEKIRRPAVAGMFSSR